MLKVSWDFALELERTLMHVVNLGGVPRFEDLRRSDVDIALRGERIMFQVTLLQVFFLLHFGLYI